MYAKKAHALAPELPWNNWKADDLGSVVMKFMENQEPYYARWAEVWYQNFQFIYGNQSVRWSRRYGYAVDADFLRKEPSTQQKAQTNISRVVAEALASLIYSSLPTWVVEASDQSNVKGKRFKRIIQKFLDAYMVRLCMDKEFSTAALIYTVFGQVGAWVDWDQNAGRIMEIPQWKKIMAPIYTDFMASNPFTGGLLEMPTPAIDSMGQPFSAERWEPVLDANGRQVVDKMFSGDGGVDILTPFEYRRALDSHGTHKTKYVERIRLMDFDDYLCKYGKVNGRTSHFDRVKPVYDNPAIYKIAVRHFMRMQFTTPPSLGDMYSRPQTAFNNANFRNKVLVVEHWDRPDQEKWDQGRRLVITNGECTHVTTPDYSTNKMDGWHPLLEAQWLTIAPSSIATGPMNDVIAKNREMNVADGLNATALRRNMASHLLIKPGIGLDPQRFSGEPGKVFEVSDVFAARYLHDEMPIPPVVAEMRQSLKDDVYETSGAGDALRGDRTVGASSGYAYRQAQEREERRLTPARKSFTSFARGIGEKLWMCVKTNCIQLDDSVMGFMMRSAAGEYQPQDVVALMSSTTDFGIEINVDEESMNAKSKATTQATLMELVQGPAGMRLQNPEVLDNFLKYFDAEVLRDTSSVHRDRAERENEVFLDMMRLGPNVEGVQKPIVMFNDSDEIHIAKHEEFLVQNAEEFLRNENMLREYLLHVETHRIQSQEKMGEALPGTALQVPNMATALRGQQPPTAQTIFQNTQMKAMQPPAPPQGGTPNSSANGAQGPTQPAPPGSKGPPQTGTQTPSQNTPSAASQGGRPSAA